MCAHKDTTMMKSSYCVQVASYVTIDYSLCHGLAIYIMFSAIWLQILMNALLLVQ